MNKASDQVVAAHQQVQFWGLQHQVLRVLFERILYEAEHLESSQAYINVLCELKMFLRFHFCSEENMMRTLDYGALEEHEAEHRKLLELLINHEMRLSKSTDNLKPQLQQIMDAIEQHRHSQDDRFIEFANNR